MTDTGYFIMEMVELPAGIYRRADKAIIAGKGDDMAAVARADK